jgi:hypothetical protein
VQARLSRATGPDKDTLAMLAGKGWGSIQMYFRLTPQQQLTLLAGKGLTFSSRPGASDLPLPPDLRKPVLQSTGFRLGAFQGTPAIVDAFFGKEGGTPLEELPEAYATVTLSVGRSELGQLKLHSSALGQVDGRPELQLMYMAGFPDLATATSPSVAKPQNAVVNAAHKARPEMRKRVSFKPAPSCPWYRPGGKPEDREGFEIKMGDRIMHFGPGGEDSPHVTSGDVWEAVHQATGLPIVADSYLRCHRAAPLTLTDKPAFEALCDAADTMGTRWQKDGEFILVRSTGYFWDKLKEVPQRYLARWRADRARNRTLPLDDLLEMATLSDAQLDSSTIGFSVGHCWGLEEWGIVGTGGAFRLGLPAGGYLRPYARFLAGLTPGQRAAAFGAAGVTLADLGPAQRDALTRLMLDRNSDPQVLVGLRVRAAYAPVGTWVWHPAAPTRRETEQLGKRLTLVTGPNAEATLAAARRMHPAAEPGQIRKSRGVLAIAFQNARGDSWQEGGPAIAFGIE